jgi:hypothetical protein
MKPGSECEMQIIRKLYWVLYRREMLFSKNYKQILGSGLSGGM